MYCVYMLRLIMRFSAVPGDMPKRGGVNDDGPVGRAPMGGEGDLEASPGGALARRTARPRGVPVSSLLSSHISPVWPVSYVWRAVGQRAAAATGSRGGADGRRGRPQGGTGRRPRAAHRPPAWRAGILAPQLAHKPGLAR